MSLKNDVFIDMIDLYKNKMEDRSMVEEYLKKIDEVIKNGRYQDTWESLAG